MDQRLRHLEQQAAAGDETAKSMLLKEYIRAGYIMRLPVELAAAYDSSTALQALGYSFTTDRDLRRTHDAICNDLFYRQLRIPWARQFFVRRSLAFIDYLANTPSYLDQELRNLANTLINEISTWSEAYWNNNLDRGSIDAHFRARRQECFNLRATFDLLDLVELYLADIMLALSLVVITETRRGDPYDPAPISTQGLQEGWFVLYRIDNSSFGLPVMRHFLHIIDPERCSYDESDVAVEYFLRHEIGLRLDNWLLTPYTTYHGLQNVPPE